MLHEDLLKLFCLWLRDKSYCSDEDLVNGMEEKLRTYVYTLWFFTPQVTKVLAAFNYEPQEEGELRLQKGDAIEVLEDWS